MASLRWLSAFITSTAVAFITLVTLEWIRPEVLLVGNVTVDVVHGNRSVGGAVSYAAAVLEAQGKRACVVTTAGEDADLSIFKNHDLHVISDNQTLTFAHSYTWWGHKRVLHVTARPSITIELRHVPLFCRLAKTVLIMPLLPTDVHSPTFLTWRNFQNPFLSQQIGLAAQGYQRDTVANGKVFAYDAPHPLLLASLGKGVSVFLSDVETDPWSDADLMKAVSSSDRLVITKGDKGSEEIRTSDSRTEIDAVKVDKVVDTNGAGDTFATAYMLAMASRSSDPGQDASNAAAQVVTKPQSCKPWCIASDELLFNFVSSNVNKSGGLSHLVHWLDFQKLSWFVTPTVLNKATES